MSHRLAAHVPKLRTMLACMCQVYLKAAVLARALNSVRVMITLEMIMLVEMYPSQKVYVLRGRTSSTFASH